MGLWIWPQHPICHLASADSESKDNADAQGGGTHLVLGEKRDRLMFWKRKHPAFLNSNRRKSNE
tara:strand:- start:222 stop:413 length:192 start_codon:yes stop_codon:yes gene_type:complete